jgi:carbon storage regulator
MLVLSRKLGEGIVLPGLDVSIKLMEVHGHRVRLGICAPQSVVVLRSEVAGAASPSRGERKVHNKESRDAAPKSALGRPAFAVAK